MEGRFGTVLVDGLIGGTWKIDRMDGAATLRVEPVVPLGRRDMDAVAQEGERLLAFTDPEASRGRVCDAADEIPQGVSPY